MFLEHASVHLLDVFVFRQKKGKYHTVKRDFSALSFRVLSSGRYIYRGAELPAYTEDLSFVPAGVSYDRETEDEEIIVIHFDILNGTEDAIRVFTPADPNPYRALFQKILSIWEEHERGYLCAATAVFYEILAQLHRDRLGEDSVHNGFIYEAARYMQANLHDSTLTIASVARHVCVSDAFLRRKFRLVYGMSPIEYLEELRMQYAVSLLKAGYFSQTEIAQRCGYADVKYFRTAFRRRMGICLSGYMYRFPQT